MEAEFDSGDRAENRQCQLDQTQGHHQRDNTVQHGFHQELLYEHPFFRSHHLAQADLLGPAGRSGRGKVHEVDACDQQDKKRDGREYVDIGDIAIARGVIPEFRMQVDICYGLDKKPD